MKKFYYELIKSWWECFPDYRSRFKLKISPIKYETYKDAHKEAIKFRKTDSTYRYDLGDRIYVRRCNK